MNKLVFPEVPLHYHLKNAILSTFDLDENLLVSSIKEEDYQKYLIIRGDGDYVSLNEEHPIKNRIVKVFFELTKRVIENNKLQSVKYHHPKIWLFIYENDHHEEIAKLVIQSENIYPYDSKEIAINFSGNKVKEEQVKNKPLLDYYDSLMPFLNKEQKEFVSSIAKKLGYFNFQLEDYEADDFEIIAPCCKDISLFKNEYDDILVITPFINVGPIKKLLANKKEGGKCVVLSRPSIIESLIISDVNNAGFISSDISDKFIHSKIYLVRKGNNWDLYAGSMNLSDYSIEKNIEAMVHLKNVKGIDTIESFLSRFLGINEEEINNYLNQYSSEYKNEKYSPVFLNALKINTRISYIKKQVINKKHDEDYIHRITSYLLSYKSITDLIELIENKKEVIPVRKEIVKNGKKRYIYCFPFEINVTLGLINYSLHQYDYLFSKNVCLHIAERSVTSAFIKLHETKKLNEYYFFKTDIHDFDPSINKEILVDKIDTLLNFDKSLSNFLKLIINEKRYYKENDNEVYEDNVMHQTGIPLAGFFENVYLYDFDFVFDKAPLYIRCGDDVLIASKNQKEIESYKDIIIKMIKERKLELNESKTKVFKPGEKLNYLGWEINNGEVDFSEESLKKIEETIKAKTKVLLIMYGKKKIPNVLRLPTVVKYVNYFQKTDFFVDSFKVITTTNGLKRIDSKIMDLIRTVISGKTGNSKYKIKYKPIQAFGYKSLVNQYYEFISKK